MGRRDVTQSWREGGGGCRRVVQKWREGRGGACLGREGGAVIEQLVWTGDGGGYHCRQGGRMGKL